MDPKGELLAQDVGTWLAEVSVRPGPDAPVQQSRGTMTNRMCGSWLVSDFKNETSGFEGHGIYGWDAVAERYVGTWIDPMRRSLVVMTGEWDADKRTLTFQADMVRPDGTHLRWREVTEKPSADVRVFRSLVPTGAGAELEVMTVRYARQEG